MPNFSLPGLLGGAFIPNPNNMLVGTIGRDGEKPKTGDFYFARAGPIFIDFPGDFPP